MFYFCYCVHRTFHKILSCFDLPINRRSTKFRKLFSVADWSQHNTFFLKSLVNQTDGPVGSRPSLIQLHHHPIQSPYRLNQTKIIKWVRAVHIWC